MRVTVFHKADREGTSFDRMCVVEAPCTDVMDALEYAYRWTNNINGSWSRSGNADSNENVTEIAPLVEWNGSPLNVNVRSYGHRRCVVRSSRLRLREDRRSTESKKQTKKELVAEMIERVGLEDRKTLINLIVNTLNVTKANAGVYIYNYKRAQ
jgi:hypothetical protein